VKRISSSPAAGLPIPRGLPEPESATALIYRFADRMHPPVDLTDTQALATRGVSKTLSHRDSGQSGFACRMARP
jgi:hypothetical protein